MPYYLVLRSSLARSAADSFGVANDGCGACGTPSSCHPLHFFDLSKYLYFPRPSYSIAVQSLNFLRNVSSFGKAEVSIPSVSATFLIFRTSSLYAESWDLYAQTDVLTKSSLCDGCNLSPLSALFQAFRTVSGTHPEFCAVANSPSLTVDCGSSCFMNPNISAISAAALSCSALEMTLEIFGFASLKSFEVCEAENLSIRSSASFLEIFAFSCLSLVVSHPEDAHLIASAIIASRS